MPILPIVFIAGAITGVASIPITGKIRDLNRHRKYKKEFLKQWIEEHKDDKPTGKEPF